MGLSLWEKQPSSRGTWTQLKPSKWGHNLWFEKLFVKSTLGCSVGLISKGQIFRSPGVNCQEVQVQEAYDLF